MADDNTDAFTESFRGRPSVTFSAAAEMNLDMFTYTNWYGYGKIKPETKETPASERDKNCYYFPTVALDMSIALSTKLGLIGGDMHVTTPAFLEFGVTYANTKTQAMETSFRSFVTSAGTAVAESTPARLYGAATSAVVGAIETAATAVHAKIEGSVVEPDAVRVDNPGAAPPAPPTPPPAIAAAVAAKEGAEQVADTATDAVSDAVADVAQKEAPERKDEVIWSTFSAKLCNYLETVTLGSLITENSSVNMSESAQTESMIEDVIEEAMVNRI